MEPSDSNVEAVCPTPLKSRRRPHSLALRRSAISLFEKGLRYKAVAREIGVPVQTVRTWQLDWKAGCFKTQEKRRISQYPDCVRAWALSAHANGKSLYQIALELKVKKGTIRKWIQRDSLRNLQGK